MAKQDIKQTRTTVDDVNEKLTSFEQRLENNKKLIYYIVGALVVVVAAVAIVALLRSSRFNAWLSAGLGLVLGGALGNLVDRIRFRAVIDFVDVYVGQWHWPAFNVADMAICVGAFLACIVIWRTPEAPEKSKEKKS